MGQHCVLVNICISKRGQLYGLLLSGIYDLLMFLYIGRNGHILYKDNLNNMNSVGL